VSFGYSIGDFIAVATTTWKTSLNTKGASESYKPSSRRWNQQHNCYIRLASSSKPLAFPLPQQAVLVMGYHCHSNLLRLKMTMKEYQKGFERPMAILVK